MPQSPDLRYETASAMDVGRRELQEDALATDFPHRGKLGFAVLSDGMGGHAAGEVASKIVVTEVFSELKLQSGDLDGLSDNLVTILKEAALAANACVHAHAENDPDTRGMGATLLAPVILGDGLRWISVGDSPLYLFRDGKLRQLNEDHSLAPQIDLMADAGLIAADIARVHPDRNCLTSVLIGEEIDKIDCPAEPFPLIEGDIVLAASDGLQTLSEMEITLLLNDAADAPAHVIADEIMSEVMACDNPQQDNVTFCVIRVLPAEPMPLAREMPAANLVADDTEEPKQRLHLVPNAVARGGAAPLGAAE